MTELNGTGSCADPASGFLPVTGDTPRILILGSFPSVKSLRHTEYYGNPQNHFWKIMDALFAIDHQLPYPDRITRLTGHHIALWDVVRTCTRKGSADEAIKEPVFNDISGFLTTHPTVRLIVLNGTTAGRYYRRMNMAATAEYRILPSTSPANTRNTLLEKVAAWEIVKENSKKEK
ncbi:MAG: DNA-deoxyinosine glycosylase [Methanomicrobiales archaeon HGW-Methanomicrobiales-5]|nr:MAG: DNA-deoxyinosine glycosylase [Methanomicrobiales archaeon HGW-Methanomicrobiales-5]